MAAERSMIDGVEVVVRGVKELFTGVAAVVGGGREASAVRSRCLYEWVCRRLPSCQMAGWSEEVFVAGPG